MKLTQIITLHSHFFYYIIYYLPAIDEMMTTVRL